MTRWVTILAGVRLAMASIRESKMRAFLTVLGVIIGTGTIIGVGSIIAGLDGAITNIIKQFGPNTMIAFKFRGGFRVGNLSPEEWKRKPLTLEDAQGGVEVIVFPEAYQRSAELLEVGTMVLVRGKLERDDDSVRILASEIVAIETATERLAREVSIHLRQPANGILEALRDVVARHRGDRKVSFELETGGPRRLRVHLDVSAQFRVKPSPALIAEVEQILGQGSVSLR